MKLLFLYGMNCTKKVWDKLNPYFSDDEIDYVEYPHNILLKSKQVEDITKWVYENYHHKDYDAIIGHSLGGIIALQLVSKYHMQCNQIIFLDTNLKPAEQFYRNLMTQEHLEKYGDDVMKMFDQERKYYTQELQQSVQAHFDYTNYLEDISQKVYGIYGDRGLPEYQKRINDLNLTENVIERIHFIFIHNACHMLMLENAEELSEVLHQIIV